MSIQKAIHAAIDQFTQTNLGSIPGVFDNMDETQLSNGTVSYIKQKVQYTKDAQYQLGDIGSRRHDGHVVIILYIRKGTGAADRYMLYNAAVKPFRSQVISGATFLDPHQVANGKTENWDLSGWQIPFYFYE